jgi:hypothetical protein
MKIVVKHIDNLQSVNYPDRQLIPQYLVYTMTDDNTPISCTVINGDESKDILIEVTKLQHLLTKPNDDFTLVVEYVSYEDNIKLIEEYE